MQGCYFISASDTEKTVNIFKPLEFIPLKIISLSHLIIRCLLEGSTAGKTLPWWDFWVRFFEPDLGFLIALLKSDKNCSLPQQVPMCFLCLIQDCLIKVTLKLSFCHRLSPRTVLLFPYTLRQDDILSNMHVGFTPTPPTPCGCIVVGEGRHGALGRTGSFPMLSQACSLDSSHFSMLEKRLLASLLALLAPLALP